MSSSSTRPRSSSATDSFVSSPGHPAGSVSNEMNSMNNPRWIPDEEVSNCMVCQKGFNAFNRRKHRKIIVSIEIRL
jgi:hypothetical protein